MCVSFGLVFPKLSFTRPNCRFGTFICVQNRFLFIIIIQMACNQFSLYNVYLLINLCICLLLSRINYYRYCYYYWLIPRIFMVGTIVSTYCMRKWKNISLCFFLVFFSFFLFVYIISTVVLTEHYKLFRLHNQNCTFIDLLLDHCSLCLLSRT